MVCAGSGASLFDAGLDFGGRATQIGDAMKLFISMTVMALVVYLADQEFNNGVLWRALISMTRQVGHSFGWR
jgi:hypothetical protein